ncbi:hypothetical protein WPS_13090 [Vulcanimicrobium alpinum]|uniref:Uncharacterized protein n=1 Tax=Vulcanimicrobium alpinum TaxID=3016050 RepID=A0AAN1XV54_UNVUL|nr:hypothetical protein WPS_13090 [Vulcanimicrobium alpinum]
MRVLSGPHTFDALAMPKDRIQEKAEGRHASVVTWRADEIASEIGSYMSSPLALEVSGPVDALLTSVRSLLG